MNASSGCLVSGYIAPPAWLWKGTITAVTCLGISTGIWHSAREVPRREIPDLPETVIVAKPIYVPPTIVTSGYHTTSMYG